MPLPVRQDSTAPSSADNPDGTAAFPIRVTPDTGAGQYPVGATALQHSSGTVANAPAVATLTAAAARTAFISELELTASGSTAALPVVATVAGLLGGTRSIIFTFPAGVLNGANPISRVFTPPLQASGPNVNIVVTLPAGGAGNTNAAASAAGYMI